MLQSTHFLPRCKIIIKDLSPNDNVPLAWLEAMSDALVRAGEKDTTDELLGSNLDGTSYENFECGDEEANNCFMQVQNFHC